MSRALRLRTRTGRKVLRRIIILAGAAVISEAPAFAQLVAAASDEYLLSRGKSAPAQIARSDSSEATGRQQEETTATNQPKTLLEALFGAKKARRDEGDSTEKKRLDPDRPHFPEASTTVGNGHVVLESGYTFSDKRSSFRSHSYPEALLRVGMFADWFELRIGQSFLNQEQRLRGSVTRENGAQDLYLGAKVALTEQDRLLPEIALIPQMTVPTGGKAVTAGRMLPGLNVDCGWEVIADRLNIELLVATNRAREDIRRSHVEIATGFTAAVNLRRDLEAFVEWDAFYATEHSHDANRARHYAVAGLVYFISKNLAIDVRTGIGLNRQANDFLAGTGFAVRY